MAASNANASATGATDRELVFTRDFKAPRALVFEVWTDPEHLAHWWGPDGFTLTTRDMDMRPGGAWSFIMHGPDGVDYGNRIVFIEVTPPERLTYRHEGEEGDEPVSFDVTVTFAEADGRTRLTMRMLFESKAELEHVVTTYGADEGAHQMMGRLGAYVEEMARRSVDLRDPRSTSR